MVSRWLPPLVVGGIALVAARLALLPGVAFWDTAELQAVAPLLGTAHPTGFPTYVLLGWLASVVLQPFGDAAFAMNLFAALSVAVAAAVMVDLVRALTGSVALGMAAGVGLALTEIVWKIGTHAEAHALHLALLAILVRLLVAWEDDRGRAGERAGDRALVAAAVVFALSMGNHSLTLLLAPGVGLFVLAVDPGILRQPRRIVVPALALLVTLVIVYAQLPLRAGPFRAPLVYGHPETWDGFWAIVLAQQFQGSLVAPFSDLPGKLVELGRLAANAFGPLALLLPLGFLATLLRRPSYALLSGLSVVITCFFAASYANADIGRYYLGPVLFAWTWLAILAAAIVQQLAPDGGAATAGAGPGSAGAGEGSAGAGDEPPVRSGRFGRAPRSLLPAGLTIILAGLLLAPTVVQAPARYARVDRSDDHEARVWIDHVLGTMEPDAAIVSWWSYSTPLWYAQRVEGQRPDIAIIDDRTRLDEGLGSLTDAIDANLPGRPVYVIRLDPAEIQLLEERYVLDTIDGIDASTLTRVVSLREPGS
jgi:hypothetical protein